MKITVQPEFIKQADHIDPNCFKRHPGFIQVTARFFFQYRAGIAESAVTPYQTPYILDPLFFQTILDLENHLVEIVLTLYQLFPVFLKVHFLRILKKIAVAVAF